MTIGAIKTYTIPATPSAVTTTSEDPDWTPGDWRTVDHSESSDEAESRPDAVLNTYNDSIAKIALSDARVEPLESKLESDWASASENEKARWEMHVDEACRAVCRVVAPKASDELLAAYRKSSVAGKVENQPRTHAENALVAAYQNAPTKSLKTQILSIIRTKVYSERAEINAQRFRETK